MGGVGVCVDRGLGGGEWVKGQCLERVGVFFVALFLGVLGRGEVGRIGTKQQTGYFPFLQFFFSVACCVVASKKDKHKPTRRMSRGDERWREGKQKERVREMTDGDDVTAHYLHFVLSPFHFCAAPYILFQSL